MRLTVVEDRLCPLFAYARQDPERFEVGSVQIHPERLEQRRLGRGVWL